MASNKRKPPVKRKKKNRQNIIIFVLSAAIVAVALFTVVTVAVTRGRGNEPTVISGTTASQTQETSSERDTSETAENKSEPVIENNITTQSETASVSSVETTEKTTAGESSAPQKSESGRIVIDTSKVQWNLIVVSLSREIPEGYRPEVVEVVNSGHDLDKRVAPYYEEMYYAAKKDGAILTPFSGNRSYERQRINYNALTETYMARYGIGREEAQKRAATVILPPGTSEHNIGIAMDICNTYDTFADSKEYAWLTENAYKYGFILRYPEGKEDITGVVFEPWHWRYVGVEYAKKIRDSGLCLEEYLDSVGIEY